MIIGIDPGFSGALAFYDNRGREGRLFAVMPMPIKRGKMGAVFNDEGRAERSEVDGRLVALAISPYLETLDGIVIEKVAASPNMGVTSAFRFGEGFGVLLGVMAAFGVTPRLAMPSVWKSSLGLSSVKAESLSLAIKLFPEWYYTLKADRGSADLAEAALLAYYGSRFIKKKEENNLPADMY